MRRRLFTLLTAFSLCLCIGAVALALASRWFALYLRWSEEVERPASHLYRSVGLLAARGGVNFWIETEDRPSGVYVFDLRDDDWAGFHARAERVPDGVRARYPIPESAEGVLAALGLWGSTARDPLITWPAFRWTVTVPCGLLGVLSAIAPVVWVVRRRRQRRSEPGICAKCGYDLRGSSGTCPECGEPIPSRPPQPAKP